MIRVSGHTFGISVKNTEKNVLESFNDFFKHSAKNATKNTMTLQKFTYFYHNFTRVFSDDSTNKNSVILETSYDSIQSFSIEFSKNATIKMSCMFYLYFFFGNFRNFTTVLCQKSIKLDIQGAHR